MDSFVLDPQNRWLSFMPYKNAKNNQCCGSCSKQIKVYRFIIIFHTENPIGGMSSPHWDPNQAYVPVYIHTWLVTPDEYPHFPTWILNIWWQIPRFPSNEQTNSFSHHILHHISPWYAPYCPPSTGSLVPHLPHFRRGTAASRARRSSLRKLTPGPETWKRSLKNYGFI